LSENNQKKENKDEIEREPIMLYASNNIQRDFNRMIERFTRDFDDFFGMPKRHGDFGIMPWGSGMPSVDVEDRGKDFLLTVEMPGFKKEDINVEVTNDYVIVQAEKRQSKEEEDKKRNYIRKERSSEAYYRRIMLPQEVNSNEAQAGLNDGILQITLPKKEPVEKKKLTVT
jgi:HSP20 family protein